MNYENLYSIEVHIHRSEANKLREAILIKEDLPNIKLILRTNPFSVVRNATVTAIVRNKLIEVSDDIYELAKKDFSLEVRMNAIKALVSLNYNQCLPYFNKVLDEFVNNPNTNEDYLNYIIFAIGEFRCRRSVDTLRALATLTFNDTLKASTLHALGKIGCSLLEKQELIAFIKSFTNEPNPMVSWVAKNSVDMLEL